MVESYDQSLLAAAPAATKAQLQEGYNPNLLKTSAPTPAPLRPSTLPVDKEGPPPPSKPPFWRTTKGIVIISLAALVIIGAIVGGAVGGTVGRSNSDDDSVALPGGNDDSSPSSDGNDSTQTSEQQAPDGINQQPEIGEAGQKDGDEVDEGIVRVLTTTLIDGQPIRTETRLGQQPVTVFEPPGAAGDTVSLQLKTTIGPGAGVDDPLGDIPFTTTFIFSSGVTSTIEVVFPSIT